MQHLEPEAEDNRTLFGWNYYPDPHKSKLRSDQLRLLPHADTDVITLLFQKPGSGMMHAATRHDLLLLVCLLLLFLHLTNSHTCAQPGHMSAPGCTAGKHSKHGLDTKAQQ